MNGTGDSIRNVVARIDATDFMMVLYCWILGSTEAGGYAGSRLECQTLFPGLSTATVRHLPHKLLENERPGGENPLRVFFFWINCR
jgi:hypothetical protein